MKNALLFVIVLSTGFISNVSCQVVTSLIVEIKTGDERFAGTDDPTHIMIGGKDFNLDNPNRDDFERNNTDLFTFEINDPNFTIELIRAVAVIRIEKTGDSFWGGGWLFAKLKVWVNDQTTVPIYTNENINKWMDGGDRSWGTTLGDSGWNLPETPPFPPCVIEDIIIFLEAKPELAVDDNSKLDSDCDGIPDEFDDTFDTDVPDADNDGLPDRFEEQNGLDPFSNDSDGDAWLDNKNVKDILLLTKVECIDEDGRLEFGSDEIYLNIEDIRFPVSATHDNYWELDDNTDVQPFIIVDERVSGSQTQSPQYKSRVHLREADFQFFEKPTDDTFESFILDWGRNETKELEFNEDGAHYKLYFKSVTINFTDIQTIENDAGDNILVTDSDGDGIPDFIEYKISTQSSDLRPNNANSAVGYDGLSDPFRPNLFIEVDATSADDKMPFDAKQQVVSQFWNQNISIKLDDGFLNGGEVLPHEETVLFGELETYKSNNQWSQRNNHYRYALYVPDMGGENGRADFPGTKFMVSRSTMFGSFSAVVFIHELGHTLNLCHPIGTNAPPSPSATCPTPPNWGMCDHYCGVDDDSVTAMGDDVGYDSILVGAGIGLAIGIGLLFIPGIGWVAGAAIILGSLIVGALGGFLFSDAYERVVDFHLNEWAVLFFNVFS